MWVTPPPPPPRCADPSPPGQGRWLLRNGASQALGEGKALLPREEEGKAAAPSGPQDRPQQGPLANRATSTGWHLCGQPSGPAGRPVCLSRRAFGWLRRAKGASRQGHVGRGASREAESTGRDGSRQAALAAGSARGQAAAAPASLAAGNAEARVLPPPPRGLRPELLSLSPSDESGSASMGRPGLGFVWTLPFLLLLPPGPGKGRGGKKGGVVPAKPQPRLACPPAPGVT